MFVLLSMLTVGLFSASDVSASVPVTDSQSSYQTAFLYFLPDYQPKDQDEAEVGGCAKLGYTVTRSNCAAPRILKGKCPAGNAYKECYCAGSTTCTGSTSSSNPYPSSSGAYSTSCVNCAGNTLYTWTCNRTCGADISSKPSNSSYTTCTDCSGTHNVGWSCNSGYHKSGNSCEEDCGPSSYNWCPVHSSCHTNCCTDGTIEPCDPQCGGSGCCEDTCSSKGYLSSKPSGKDCSTISVCGSTCYYNCMDTEPAHTHSYTCPSGYSSTNSWGSEARTASKTCSCGESSGTCYAAPSCVRTCATAITSKPANSSYTTCTDCTGTYNTGWSCNSGYHASGSSCVEDVVPCTLPDCTSTVTSKPANSSYTTQSCTDCSGSKTINIGWTCNSGYHASGSSCVEDVVPCTLPDCTSTVTSKPANSSYTTQSCTDCSGSKTINIGWTCNSGYSQSGNSCVCAKTCSDTVTSKPANSHYTTENCTACGSSKTINTGWECDSGYSKSGNSCEKPENCSQYQSSPWVVNGSDVYSKCQALGMIPSSTTATCGGTTYNKCGTRAQCPSGYTDCTGWGASNNASRCAAEFPRGTINGTLTCVKPMVSKSSSCGACDFCKISSTCN